MNVKSLILLLVLIAAPAFAEEPIHYCDDAEAWAEWQALIDKYPEDDDLRAGYALRLGLCQEVKAGTIETSRAIRIFERYMNALKELAAYRERIAKREQNDGA